MQDRRFVREYGTKRFCDRKPSSSKPRRQKKKKIKRTWGIYIHKHSYTGTVCREEEKETVGADPSLCESEKVKTKVN